MNIRLGFFVLFVFVGLCWSCTSDTKQEKAKSISTRVTGDIKGNYKLTYEKVTNTRDDSEDIAMLKSADLFLKFDVRNLIRYTASFKGLDKTQDGQYVIAGDSIRINFFDGEEWYGTIAQISEGHYRVNTTLGRRFTLDKVAE